ncbi:acyl-CoA synthetase [soil metagenome]
MATLAKLGPVERLTAGASDALQRRVAGALQARGLTVGDRVVFSARSSGSLLSAILGARRGGIVAVVLNPDLLDHERAQLTDDADPRLVVTDADLSTLAEGPPVDLAPVPLARPMHYTSGTTGRPKGVWSGVLTEPAARALAAEERDLWGFAADDRHLVCSPLHHSAPIRFAAGTLLAGGEVLLLGRFDAVAARRAIAEAQPTTTFVVPAHLQRLVAEDEPPPLDSFRLIAHAGAPCPLAVKEALIGAAPAGSVWEFYGSTEGQFTACSTSEWRDRPGTVGRARPGRRLHTDADGTIWCDVPDHARFSYWRDPGRTAAAWRGAAFTVGDLGRVDDSGYLYLDGRRDDLIISGGVNVYPVEVERALLGGRGVVEVAVFGVDDPRWGQRVCAAVVGDVDPVELVAHARRRLTAYKVPKQVFVVDELPRTSTGKVRRADLSGRLGLGPAGTGDLNGEGGTAARSRPG